MNYGETLAYWYLRLNGFFLLRNFVLHPLHESEANDRYTADSDLLACTDYLKHPSKKKKRSLQYPFKLSPTAAFLIRAEKMDYAWRAVSTCFDLH